VSNSGDYLPPPIAPQKRAPSCWLIGGLGCLGFFTVLWISMAIGFYQVLRTPNGKQLVREFGNVIAMSSKIPEAQKKITDIRGALIRYDLKNSVYPISLKSLQPDYLPDKSELHCALDSNPDPNHISFVYTQPSPGASSSTKILSLSWSMTMDSDHQQMIMQEVLTDTLGGRLIQSQYQDGKLIMRQSYASPPSD
jgi:hypothetical protein